MKKTLLGAFANRRARQNLGSSLETTVASTSDSGQPSSQNASGTSATSADVLKFFDSVFEETGSADDFKSYKLALIRSLNNRIEQYSNLGLDGCPELPQWQPDVSLLDASNIAMQCAAHVYGNSKEEPVVNGYGFETVKSIGASMNGVVKATRCIKVTSLQPKEYFPALVITIRGTRPGKIADWLVNFNQDLEDTSTLIDYEHLAPNQSGLETVSRVHAGFLNGVLALLPELLVQINAYIATTSNPHIMFTGHSAGGAVAALAFAHFMSKSYLLNAQASKPRYSLLTFGSPPVLSNNITARLKQATQIPQKSIMLAIVNENDAVARLDRPYVESISQLYETTSPTRINSLRSAKRMWRLPPPQLYHIGDLIVLKQEQEKAINVVRGYQVTPELFSDTVFYDLAAHPKAVYQKNIASLLAADAEPLAGLEYLGGIIQ